MGALGLPMDGDPLLHAALEGRGAAGWTSRWAWVLARGGMGVSGPRGRGLSATERGASVMRGAQLPLRLLFSSDGGTRRLCGLQGGALCPCPWGVGPGGGLVPPACPQDLSCLRVLGVQPSRFSRLEPLPPAPGGSVERGSSCIQHSIENHTSCACVCACACTYIHVGVSAPLGGGWWGWGRAWYWRTLILKICGHHLVV